MKTEHWYKMLQNKQSIGTKWVKASVATAIFFTAGLVWISPVNVTKSAGN